MATVQIAGLPPKRSRLQWFNWEETNNDDLRRQSEALDALRRGDYESVCDAIEEVFGNAADIQPRFVPLVEHYTRERATLYERPPYRAFDQAEGGAKPEVYRKFRRIYAESRIDDAMEVALAKLVSQQTVILAVLPVALGRVEVMAFCPYELEVEPAAEAWRAHDITAARRVTLRVPVSATDVETTYGKLVMTQDRIWLEAEGNDETPVYSDSLANPFGRVPLVVLRSVDPDRGRFFAPVDEFLLAEAMALSMAVTDLDHKIRMAFPQKVLTQTEGGVVRPSDLQSLPTGPEHWAVLPEGASLDVVHSSPQIAEAMALVESRLKNFARLRGLPADTFLRQYTNITAITLQQHDRRVARRRFEKVMERAETELARLIADVCGVQGDLINLPPDTVVRIRWGEWVVDADDQSAAQGRETAYRTGERSVVDHVARRDNIGLSAAEAKVKQNRARNAALAGGSTEDT